MKKTTPRHIIINLFKTRNKRKILKAARGEKCALHTGTKIRMTMDFLSETMQVRRQQSHIFKMLKKQNYQPKILHPGKISLKNEGK